jgi:hypothetical protein
MYRSKKQREKLNAFTRRKQNLSIDVDDSKKEHQHQRILKENQLNQHVKKALALCVLIKFAVKRASDFRTCTKKNDVSNNSNASIDHMKMNDSHDVIISEEEDKDTQSKEDQIKKSKTSMEETSLITKIKESFVKDEIFIKLREIKIKNDRKVSLDILRKNMKLFMKNLEIKNDLLYLKNKLMILSSDKLRLRLLRRYHDSSIKEHSEYKSMFHSISSSYF